MAATGPGARWVRAALQVNPYAYKGANQPSQSFSSEDDYNQALLGECDNLGIELIGVTDHWSVDTAAGLIAAATDHGVAALPGFEANSSEGVHLLVLFEVGTPAATVNAAIGACGATPGCANGTTGHSFKQILEAMTDAGALVIPAHINVPNSGMLMGRAGQPLVAMVTDPALHAVAITPSKPEGTDQQAIIKGSKPYDRSHPLAILHADDIVKPSQLSDEGSTTWFKLSSVKLDSLKVAVRTPQTRVSCTDPATVPRAVLTEISWVGGFLDGVTIPISSDLTALIGGRGTGKSTVVESLRYVLDLAPVGEQASKDHKAIVEKVLRSGTVVKVGARVTAPAPRTFTIERVVPGDPVVRDASGAITSQQPSDVIGSVEVFGQHELAELAGRPESVAEMLRRFSGSSGPDPAHISLLGKLADNRKLLEKSERDREKLVGDLADIPRLEEQVKHYQESEVARRLSELKQIGHDESIYKEGSRRVAAVASGLDEFKNLNLEGELRAPYDGIDTSPQAEQLRQLEAITQSLANRIKDLVDAANMEVQKARAAIAISQTAWETAVAPQREANDEILRGLHEEGLEPDKYLATSRALDELRARQPRLAGYDATLKTLKAERENLLRTLRDLETKQTEQLHVAVRAANDSTGGSVVVKPMAAPDRQSLIELVSRNTSGQRTQIIAAIESSAFTPQAFVKAVREGTDALERLGIRGAQAATLVKAGESLCRELEERSVGMAVEVFLDVAPDGRRELRKLDDLSKGQKATALLLLLLGASSAPLVIDQPEDDLDNRFVYDGIVANLRKLKGYRQVIASTHNANVPVLGDAELIVALEGDGQNGRPAADGIGSLDDAPIRHLAERILEGGPDAFNARKHLYGF